MPEAGPPDRFPDAEPTIRDQRFSFAFRHLSVLSLGRPCEGCQGGGIASGFSTRPLARKASSSRLARGGADR